MKWISVKDQLPEPNIDILVFIYIPPKNKMMAVGKYKSDNLIEYPWFCYDNDFAKDDVTHWMPLPEEPK